MRDRLHTTLLATCVALLLLVLAAPVSAETRTETFRTPPITVAGYQVKQEQAMTIPKPDVDGFITDMSVDVVNKDGTPVGIEIYQYASRIADLSRLEAEGPIFGLVPAPEKRVG